MRPTVNTRPDFRGVPDAAHLRSVLGHFCTGIVVITGGPADAPTAFSCQSFASLSLEPSMILICPSKTSRSWPRINAAGHFGVNILARDQEELCRQFAVSGADKFAGIGW